MRTTACTALLGALMKEASKSAEAEQQQTSPAPQSNPSEAAASETRSTAVIAAADDQCSPAAVRQPASQPGRIFWTDGKAKDMSFALRAVAMVTLLLFVSWIWIISFLMLGAPFSKVAATLAVGAWLTLLLPCQVRFVHCRQPIADEATS